jgi:hypothetical protein
MFEVVTKKVTKRPSFRQAIKALAKHETLDWVADRALLFEEAPASVRMLAELYDVPISFIASALRFAVSDTKFTAKDKE